MTKQPKITYGAEELLEYTPPVLFPEIGKYPDSGQQRDYVREMIDFYAAKKDLCVTDMLAQPAKIRNLCGRIIFGIDINPDSLREERAQDDLKPETMGYPVRIKVINSRAPSVKFKRGVVNSRIRTSTISPSGKALDVGMGAGNSVSWSRRVVKKVDEVVDYGDPEATMGLRDAWICLSKHGEYCLHAFGRQVEKKWLYREVDEHGAPLVNRHKTEQEQSPARRARA